MHTIQSMMDFFNHIGTICTVYLLCVIVYVEGTYVSYRTGKQFSLSLSQILRIAISVALCYCASTFSFSKLTLTFSYFVSMLPVYCELWT